MSEDLDLEAIRRRKLKELEAKLASRGMQTRRKRVAVPSMYPGGLQALSSGHFGHCDVFTIVDLEDDEVKEVKVVKNEHIDGSCMTPVNLLKYYGVQAILVNGIGIRPLTFFRQMGMEVYAGAVGTVDFVVNEYIQGNLRQASDTDVCGHSQW